MRCSRCKRPLTVSDDFIPFGKGSKYFICESCLSHLMRHSQRHLEHDWAFCDYHQTSERAAFHSFYTKAFLVFPKKIRICSSAVSHMFSYLHSNV